MAADWVQDVGLDIQVQLAVTVSSSGVDLSLVEQYQALTHGRVLNWEEVVLDLSLEDLAVGILAGNDWTRWQRLKVETSSCRLDLL